MKKIKIFIIFHRDIYSLFYKKLIKYKENVIYVGVQKRISKWKVLLNRYDIIYEKDFYKYNKSLSNAKLHETSAICHVYLNDLYKDLDYVGFAQYDMKINDNAFDLILKYIENGKNKKYIFYSEKISMNYMYGIVWLPKFIQNYLIDSYNSYFNTNYDLSDLLKNLKFSNNLIIYSTFVIPTEMYKKVMGWIVKLSTEPVLDEHISKMLPDAGMGHVIERAYGLALALEFLNGEAELIHIPMEHIIGYGSNTYKKNVIKKFLLDKLGPEQYEKLNLIYNRIKKRLKRCFPKHCVYTL